MPEVKKDKSVEEWQKLWKKKKGEITKHTRFLSTSNVDFQVDDGRDDDAAAGDDEDADDFVDTDSDSAVAGNDEDADDFVDTDSDSAVAGDDEDADDFVDTNSDSTVADASASEEHDDIEEDGNGDGVVGWSVSLVRVQ